MGTKECGNCCYQFFKWIKNKIEKAKNPQKRFFAFFNGADYEKTFNSIIRSIDSDGYSGWCDICSV